MYRNYSDIYFLQNHPDSTELNVSRVLKSNFTTYLTALSLLVKHAQPKETYFDLIQMNVLYIGFQLTAFS